MTEFIVVECSEVVNREAFSLLEELEVGMKSIYLAYPGMNLLGTACPEPETSAILSIPPSTRGAESWILG